MNESINQMYTYCSASAQETFLISLSKLKTVVLKIKTFNCELCLNKEKLQKNKYINK